MDDTSGPSRVTTIPSSDSAFREHVERLRASDGIARPEALQARLRRLFPRVIVRERSLSAETPSWYVYRDGRWLVEIDGPWWEARGIPHLRVSKAGWIVDGDPTALGILGITPAELGARHFTDFAAPGTLEDAEALFQLVVEGRSFTGTVILQPTSGDAIAVDVHSVPEAETLSIRLRLAEDVEVEAWPIAPRPDIATLPAGDPAFAAYARRALAGIPEPTPDGLALRLRRLYPHARVEIDGARWIARRDGDAGAAADAGAGWWQDETLPQVRYDAQALILDANDAARKLLGSTLVGHHWQEFVTPGSTDEVAAMLAILAETGGAESRFRMPSADGSLVEFDSYTEVAGESYTTTMRPRG